MLEMFLGFAGMLICLAAFVGGVIFERSNAKKEIQFVTDESELLTTEEIEAKKRELIDSEKAFKEQMSYGVEMAYRIPTKSRDGELI